MRTSASPRDEGAIPLRDLIPLNRVKVRDETEVRVLIATPLGSSTFPLAEMVRAAGGTVEKVIEDIGYVRATVPLGMLSEFRNSELVEDATLSVQTHEPYPVRPQPIPTETKEEAKTNIDAVVEVPLEPLTINDLPVGNPYVPTRDVGAPQFIASYPTFDGRGVTIGIVEGALDFGHETLRQARELDGSLSPKVIGLWSAREPGDEHQRAIQMRSVVADEGSFRDGDAEYRAPVAGHYHFGTYSHEGENWGILWDKDRGLVWVANGDHDFSQLKPGGDFNKTLQTIPLGHSNEIAVTLHPNEDVIIVHRPRGHTTSMAGIAAGHGFLGGVADGVAPSAKLALIETTSGIKHSVIESFALAASRPEIDLIVCSSWIEAESDGESFCVKMIERIVDRYDKLVVAGAGNWGVGGLDTGHNLANAPSVLSVGGYSHRDTLQVAYGETLPSIDYANPAGSRGPAGNGRLKPDVIAPIMMLAAGHAPAGPGIPGLAPRMQERIAPPNYRWSMGSSFAGPVVAGVAAILISAAKQSGVRYGAKRLRWAIRTGARFLDDWSAHEQGCGLVDVTRSWELLQGESGPVEFRTTAPVQHGASHELPIPNRGAGLYERNGWRAGDEGERTIVFQRLDPAEVSRLSLTWLGNDGTFDTDPSIELGRDKPTSLRVRMKPRSRGAHSAILNLADPTTGIPVHQVMCTVIASEPFTARRSYTLEHEGRIQPLRFQSVFVDVPSDTPLLRISLTINEGAAWTLLNDPAGELEFAKYVRNPAIYDYPKINQPSGEWSRLIRTPEPGVWEINVIEGFSRVNHTDFRLSTSILGADLTLSDDAKVAEVHNRLAPVLGGVVATAEGKYDVQEVVSSADEPGTITLTIPEGTTLFSVTARPSGDIGSEAGILLYHSVDGTFRLWDHSSLRRRSRQSIRVRYPSPGDWLISLPLLAKTNDKAIVSCEMVTAGQAEWSSEKSFSPGERWKTDVSKPMGSDEPPVITWMADAGAERHAVEHALMSFIVGGGEPLDFPIELAIHTRNSGLIDERTN